VRWIITGAAGMLGQDVVAVLRDAGEDTVPLARTDLDVTDSGAVARAVEGADVVVNCAAWTAVDDAEAREADAFAINATAASYVARAAHEQGSRLVHISTDYVFAGSARSPYPEDAPLGPRSAYGRTKAAGEWAVQAHCPDHLLLRTAWLYGAYGRCFPKTIARAAGQRDHLDVVDDQIGQPTWTRDVADLVLRLVVASAPSGTYHATASGQVSWHGFARAVVAAAGGDPRKVRPTTSEAFVRPAPRPAYSVLGHGSLRAAGVEPIGDWAQRWDVAAPDVLGADVPAADVQLSDRAAAPPSGSARSRS
jgi:dTDP-4-dehydrorhamnose reductase